MVATFVVLLDQITKHLILWTLQPGQFFPLGLLDIRHVRNTGAAFGILPSGGQFFIWVGVLVLSCVALSYRRIQQARRLTVMAVGLISGGTLGNLLDRLRFGYVVDFIDLRWWPVFNLADSAICVGVGLLIWQIFQQPSSASQPSPASNDSSSEQKDQG